MTMKRTFLIFLFAIISCCIYAQTTADLVGSWLYTYTDNSDGDIMTIKEYLELKEDGSCSKHGQVYMEMVMDETSKFHAQFSYSAKGTWDLQGDVITYNMDPKSISVTNANENNMPGILKTMFFNPVKSEFKKELKKPSPSRVISFSSKELVLKDTRDKDATDDHYKKL